MESKKKGKLQAAPTKKKKRGQKKGQKKQLRAKLKSVLKQFDIQNEVYETEKKNDWR